MEALKYMEVFLIDEGYWGMFSNSGIRGLEIIQKQGSQLAVSVFWIELGELRHTVL